MPTAAYVKILSTHSHGVLWQKIESLNIRKLLRIYPQKFKENLILTDWFDSSNFHFYHVLFKLVHKHQCTCKAFADCVSLFCCVFLSHSIRISFDCVDDSPMHDLRRKFRIESTKNRVGNDVWPTIRRERKTSEQIATLYINNLLHRMLYFIYIWRSYM